MSLLRAMGMDVRSYPSNLTLNEWSPSEAGADLHKWKKKLRAAFGVKDISKGRQPVSRAAVQTTIWRWFCYRKPLQRLTKVPETSATMLFQGRRVAVFPGLAYGYTTLSKPCATSCGRLRCYRHDDDSSDSDYGFWDQVDEDPREELVRQMDALCATNTSDSGPRLELASHTPLDLIKLFSGRCNKSDNSMQWLKTFAFR
ncbi:hypothetical protein PC120_g4461 [Phytophthora cactorum]|nr:hypothetical protein PC120_g4461 [Phytophthora cactorum]